jgi:predicted GNAT superfamily acetyltransferase
MSVMSSQGNGLVDANITIRRAESVADYRACQEAQRRSWGIAEEGYVIPVATMVGANLHGGLVLGAFLPDGSAVAMSFGFLGRVGDRVCLYSQLTGVVPEYQSRGLGYAVKLVQRYLAQSEGLRVIAWAFDPLQAGNAHFNIHRLGARSCRYVDNMYGERTDALNAGVPTDRLIVEWEIDPADEPAQKVPPDIDSLLASPRMIAIRQSAAGIIVPQAVQAVEDAPRLLLEIPARIAELRQARPELAESWRRAVHDAFHAGFAAGYQVVEFFREEAAPECRCYYVLERKRAEDAPGSV